MADYGANYTDQELVKLEKRIKKVYGEAAKDIEIKMNSFTAKSKAKEQKYLQKVAKGEMTQAEFDKWKAGQVFQGKQWAAKKDEIADVLYNANTVASKIVNNEQFNVFAANANFASYQMEQGAGVNFGFSLYDQNTVIRLIKDEPNLLPNYVPKKSKDMTWNTKKITRQITQGIIQGESLDKISKRLATVTASQNMNSMKTHARTLMTGAQNAGRLNSYENAQKLGIEVEKEWMATLDSHTRDSHASLDGEIVPIDKPFSNGLMYPGDPDGDPAEVYNCRCTMVSDIKKYPSIYNRYDNESRERIRNMSYGEWEDAKKTGKSMAPYSVNKIKIGDLFQGLSQNGAYTKIHDIDVTLSNQFYKELQEMGKAYSGGAKPAQVWNDYLNDDLPNGVSADKLEDLMSQYKDKAAATPIMVKNVSTISSEISKTVKEINSLEDAQKALKEAQDAIIKAGADKEFTGIWKDPVTYKDYETKKDSIQAKKDYYLGQIAKYKADTSSDPDWLKMQTDKYAGYLKQLEEFEKNGKAYSELYKNLELAQGKVKEFTPLTISGKGFAADAYDPKVKAASKAFSSGKDADKFYRPELDKQWKNMPDKEKYAVWEYTHNSNPMNKPLSGYEETWSRSGFVGLDKANWGHEDKYRSLGSKFKRFGTDGHVDYKETITNLTKAIDKAEINADVNLVRGSDKGGFAGLLEGNLFSYKDAEALLQKDEKTIKAALEGQVFQNHAFTSTGIAKGTGFGGEVKYEIYAPKGTKGIYAEPQSYFGNTISGEELYKPGQSYSSIGGEAEVILQRGTEYRITEVTKDSYQLTVKMEVVGQPDYFKYGDEDTFNAGITRHKK